MHLDRWKPSIGEMVVFFNGHAIGLLLGLPLLVTPTRGSDGALVQRSSGVESSRILDLFAGVGGWEHAFDLLPQSPFGPFENREVVSVELDLAPATSLAKTTKRVLRKPGLNADPIDAMGQVLHADVRDPTWYFLSLEAPFTDPANLGPWQAIPWVLLALMGYSFLGLLLLFAPQRSIGENVPGLIEHPDWPKSSRVDETVALSGPRAVFQT